MTFLPIVDRELRARARRRSTYWVRLGAAGVAIAIAIFMLLLIEGAASPISFGSSVFYTLAWLTFVYCLLEGARSTTDCLSEEKRDGTLGLLFLTDLRGYDVVLGKFAATSLNSFYGLLAMFPALAIPLVLGGVTAGEFWRVVLLLMVTLLFSITTGLFVSSVSRNERKAWATTFGVIGMLGIVAPLAAWALTLVPVSGWFAAVFPMVKLPTDALASLSPTTALLSSFDAEYAADSSQYWNPLLTVHLLSWILLGGASYLLPRCWQDAPVRRRSSLAGRWAAWMTGLAPQRRHQARAHLLATNPVKWLARRNEEHLFFVWCFVALGGCGGLGLAAFALNSPQLRVALFFYGLALHFILGIWVAIQACSVYPEARDSGALELLLTTPVDVRQIVDGHAHALRWLFARPVLALVMMELIALLTLAAKSLSLGQEVGVAIGVTIGIVVCLFTVVLDLLAVGLFGLWMGLVSRKPGQALTKTVLFVLVLPALGGFCCTLLWPVMGLVKNLIFINYALDQLRRQFRQVVTEGGKTQAAGVSWTGTAPRGDAGRLPPVLPERGGPGG